MLPRPVVQRPPRAATSIACLVGVLAMGAVVWAGVIWLAETCIRNWVG